MSKCCCLAPVLCKQNGFMALSCVVEPGKKGVTIL